MWKVITIVLVNLRSSLGCFQATVVMIHSSDYIRSTSVTPNHASHVLVTIQPKSSARKCRKPVGDTSRGNIREAVLVGLGSDGRCNACAKILTHRSHSIYRLNRSAS